MPISAPTSLDAFYDAIITQLHRKGVPCAITGGLACVEFGIVEHTEDCDLIFAAGYAETVLEVLLATPYGTSQCQYRKTSPPIDTRWLRGGYTAHFLWPTHGQEKPFLDVFGAPPRVSTPWEKETIGSFAGMHTVAEMKRTNRRKDWDIATALGLEMLKRGDCRGWLHIFDAAALRALVKNHSPGEEEVQKRPVLQLAMTNSPLLDRAVQTEVEFWTHLNELRLNIYQNSHEPYGRAMNQVSKKLPNDLTIQHTTRVQYAEKMLPKNPLHNYGVERLIAEAKAATAIGLDPAILQYLPQISSHFDNIARIIQ
jgi:hypothetical protein